MEISRSFSYEEAKLHVQFNDISSNIAAYRELAWKYLGVLVLQNYMYSLILKRGKMERNNEFLGNNLHGRKQRVNRWMVLLVANLAFLEAFSS